MQTSGGPLTVFLVDDNPGDVELTRIAFEDAGLDVRLDVALEGGVAEMALAAMARGEIPLPDLVLLDINLPGYDGRDLLAYLKRQPALRGVPAVMLTTSGAAADLERCRALGADDYIVKPSAIEDLSAALVRVLPLVAARA